MTDDDLAAFGQAMTLLAETMNEPMSPARIEGYWLALEDLTLDEVRTAVRQALREQTEYFPKPAKLREYARPKKQPVANWEAYKPYVPPDRPALPAPVDMGSLVSGVVAQLEAAVVEKQRAEVPTMTADEIAARKAALREQAKRLLMDEPEGEA
jgi:hypothetical protein